MPPDCNIIQRLKAVAEKDPDRTALVQAVANGKNNGARPDEQISFACLEEKSAAYARFFLNHGLGPQDRALLLMPPAIGFYTIFLALARIGVSIMLVDPGVGLGHFTACTRQVQPTVFIAPPKGHLLRLRPGFAGPVRGFSPSFVPFAATLREAPPKSGGSGLDPVLASEHPALVTFTSGSSGRPKAIMRTHGFLLRQGDALAGLMPAHHGDVEFCSFPVFTLANLAQGVTTLLPPAGARSLEDIHMADVAGCMERHGATRLLASPDFCNRLGKEVEANNKGFLRLRTVHTGGGPVFLPLLDKLAALAPGAHVCSLYGSTEAEPVALQDHAAISQPWRERVRAGGGLPAGRPVDTVCLRIIRDHTGTALPTLSTEEFETLVQPAGQAGELVVSGPLVQQGYMNPEDDAETKIRVGETTWHRTGDAGHCDADGTLWLLGRCSAKIKTGEGFLYPLAVEAAASTLPAVRRTALVEARGKIILVVEGECDEAKKALLLQTHILLDEVIQVDRIPMDSRHNSKVLYEKLRKMLE